MIIYGSGEKTLKVKQDLKYICPECGKNGIKFHFFQEYIHIFWIPLIPIARRKVAHCETCGIAYENKHIPQKFQDELTRLSKKTIIPIYLFSGLIIILLGIGGIIYNNQKSKTYYYPSGEKEAIGKMKGDYMDGEWTFWYKNGEQQCVQYFDEGIENGNWKWWRDDGTLKEAGEYQGGLENGLWVWYYPSEVKQSEIEYVNGRMHGDAKGWYENGQKYFEGAFNRDKKEGKWTYWYENGNVSEEGEYINDIQIGDWLYYYDTGDTSTVTNEFDTVSLIVSYWDYEGNQLIKDGNGYLTLYYQNGNKESQGYMKNGLHSGKWTHWHENGELASKASYNNNETILHDVWTVDGEHIVIDGNGYYHYDFDNGIIQEEGQYTNGKQTGLWITRSEDNVELVRASYRDGKLDDQVIIKNETGLIESKTNYIEGLAHGYQKHYFETGEPLNEGEMENNKQTGYWTWYHESGELLCQVNFTEGKKEGEQIFWNESGIIVKKEFYENGELVNEEIIY